jgi:hypothetical protein
MDLRFGCKILKMKGFDLASLDCQLRTWFKSYIDVNIDHFWRFQGPATTSATATARSRATTTTYYTIYKTGK